MITTCTVCQARYQLDDEKIPKRVIRVRCPSCSGVFMLDGNDVGPKVEAPAHPAATTEPVAGFSSEPRVEPTPAVSVEPTPPVASAPVPAAEPMAEPTAAASTPDVSVAVSDEPAPSSGRRRRCKEEMLARALVSDILVYNRDLRDSALADGSLLESLGGEIKKSWELYKEKVTPEVANSTNYFREALNEILAEGEQMF